MVTKAGWRRCSTTAPRTLAGLCLNLRSSISIFERSTSMTSAPRLDAFPCARGVGVMTLWMSLGDAR